MKTDNESQANKNDEQKILEKLVVFSIEVAQNMLDEYDIVIPFGVRAYADSDEIKMQCFQEKHPKSDWEELIKITTDALKKSVAEEDIFATAIVLSVDADGSDDMGVGLQIDTPQSPAMFVYPYHKKDNKWVIDEPMQVNMLVAPRVFKNH